MPDDLAATFFHRSPVTSALLVAAADIYLHLRRQQRAWLPQAGTRSPSPARTADSSRSAPVANSFSGRMLRAPCPVLALHTWLAVSCLCERPGREPGAPPGTLRADPVEPLLRRCAPGPPPVRLTSRSTRRSKSAPNTRGAACLRSVPGRRARVCCAAVVNRLFCCQGPGPGLLAPLLGRRMLRAPPPSQSLFRAGCSALLAPFSHYTLGLQSRVFANARGGSRARRPAPSRAGPFEPLLCRCAPGPGPAPCAFDLAVHE